MMFSCDVITKGKEPFFLQKFSKSVIYHVLRKSALAVSCTTNKAIMTESNF